MLGIVWVEEKGRPECNRAGDAEQKAEASSWPGWGCEQQSCAWEVLCHAPLRTSFSDVHSPTESRWDGNEGWRVRRQIPSLCVDLAWNHPAVMHADLILWLCVLPTLDPFPASPNHPRSTSRGKGRKHLPAACCFSFPLASYNNHVPTDIQHFVKS